MGLDITVYQKNTKLSEVDEDYDFEVYNYKEFVDRCKTFEFGGKYISEKSTKTVSYPYSTHNEFRRELAKLLQKDSDFWNKKNVPKDVPFYEFFDFADNQGCIDEINSESLYNDFVEYEKIALIKLSKYWESCYKEWMNTFDLGRQNGVVVFS